MKKIISVCMIFVLCLSLTACSPYDAGDKVTEFTTNLERKFTEYREKAKVKWDEFLDRFDLEKDNVETLWNDRNLDEKDDNISEDANTEEIIEDVTNIENWDSSIEQEQRQQEENSNNTETTENN